MEGKGFSVKEKIGYGTACVGDTAIYNLLIIYGMFFLTDIVKLDPVIAGNITLIATLWNAVSVGLVGYVSDHLPLKGGKRLPYMKVSILPMAITLVMFFTVIGGGTFALAVYYTVIMALLMTFHSSFMVPYEALGADLTMDGESRMALRSYARFFMGIGNLVGVVFLLPAVEQCENAGLSQTRAWQVVIGAIAVIGMISQITTCTIFRDAKSRGKKEIKEEKTLKLFHEYRDLLRLKPMLMLLSVTILVNVANIFCNSSIAYFMKYNLGITENSKAFVMGIMTVAGIVMTPILAGTSKRYDKKKVMIVCYIMTGAMFLFFGVVSMGSVAVLCIYIFIFTIATSAYWQLIYGMLYDISEFDELENNRRREALILSLSKVILKVSNAFATQMLGIVLFLFKYDQNSSIQLPETLTGIQICLTFIPGVLFLAAAVVVIKYPISEKYHGEIVNKLEERKNH